MGSSTAWPTPLLWADDPNRWRGSGDKARVSGSGSTSPKASKERDSLQRHIEQSYDTIARSRKIIALLEQIVAQAERNQAASRPERRLIRA